MTTPKPKPETEESLRQAIEEREVNKDIWGRLTRPNTAPDIKGRDVAARKRNLMQELEDSLTEAIEDRAERERQA